MTNENNYMVIFLKEMDDGNGSLLGFGLMSKQESKEYVRCVKLLNKASASFDADRISVLYTADDFSTLKLNANDIKFLNKIFDLDNDSKVRHFS